MTAVKNADGEENSFMSNLGIDGLRLAAVLQEASPPLLAELELRFSSLSVASLSIYL